jgi:7-carboxy-7-deazaguanine synthase
MRIAEIFHSIQGEGRLAGVPSVFIRTSGCNLRCHWCDTPYTSWSPEGESMSVGDILAACQRLDSRHVVVTGGEPMIAPQITELTAALKDAGYHITVETAATVFVEVTCDLASLSPKLANSTPHERDGGRYAEMHEHARINVPVIQRWIDRYDHQLKFVVEGERDLAEIDALLGELRGIRTENVLLMPEGIDAESLRARGLAVAELCVRRGFRFCPRLHIELYGNVRGT